MIVDHLLVFEKRRERQIRLMSLFLVSLSLMCFDCSERRNIQAIVEKSFWTSLKFYLVPVVVIKYLQGNYFCVSKTLTASEAQKQMEIIQLIIANKSTTCVQFLDVLSGTSSC